MKRLLVAAVAAILMMSACEPQAANTEYINRMEDTLFNALPTVNRLTIKVETEFLSKNIIVTLGDAELYNGTEEARKEAVDKVANITLNVFDKEHWPEKGEVVFTANETSLTADDAKTYDMELEKKKTP